MNRVCLMGRLTRDPELRQTQNGVSVTSFSIAVNRKYDKETADFIDVVAWRQTAEFVTRYFGKGDMIAVEGVIQTRTYEDRQGNNRKAVEVVADQVYFCGSKQSGNTEGAPQAPTARAAQPQSSNQSGETQSSFSIDGLGDFEEVDTPDSELPF